MSVVEFNCKNGKHDVCQVFPEPEAEMIIYKKGDEKNTTVITDPDKVKGVLIGIIYLQIWKLFENNQRRDLNGFLER